MKTFEQFLTEGPHVGVSTTVNQTGTTDTYDVQDPSVLKRVNAFVGSIADREYLIPENAIHQLKNFLERIGLSFEMPTLPEGNGSVSVDLLRWGGVFGKSTDTPFDEFDNDAGILLATIIHHMFNLNIYSNLFMKNNKTKISE